VKVVRFTEKTTGLTGMRIYRRRLSDREVVWIHNGTTVDVTIDGKALHGTIIRSDDTTTELDILLGDVDLPVEIATRKPPVAARMRPPRVDEGRG
jgi:hypothetical protein